MKFGTIPASTIGQTQDQGTGHRPTHEAPRPAFDGGPINILIVDDEPRNLTVLESILDNPNYRLIRAESADQALLALVVEEFALLILDIRMPGMTGFELAQMIKERKKTAQVPIIFLTAYYNEDQHVLEGYVSGAVDYLHKPVNPAILRSKVAIFAELYSKRRECVMANRALLAEVNERRRAEEMLRSLTNRVVQFQEDECSRVALELHDNITQSLCAVLFRSEALVNTFSDHDGPQMSEAIKMRDILGHTIREVERISSNLRPSSLDLLGLIPVIRETCTEFENRTKVIVKLDCMELAVRLPFNIELALYRILQEALKNVELHARAYQVAVTLTKTDEILQLSIKDDGIGFSHDVQSFVQPGKKGLGLLSMRERTISVGGAFKLNSAPNTGTEVEVRIPLLPQV